jgi:hypothetical protein
MGGRAPSTGDNAIAWMGRAGCRYDDPEVFFDERNSAMAKATCRFCPVRTQCLTWIRSVEGPVGPTFRHGVYGGMTSNERARKFGPASEAAA